MSTVIDVDGRVVAEIDRPLGWQGFREGLAAASFGALTGVIDVSGRTVIPPQFDDVGPFDNGVAAFSRGKWNGLVNRDGTFAWGPTQDWVHSDHTTLSGEWA